MRRDTNTCLDKVHELRSVFGVLGLNGYDIPTTVTVVTVSKKTQVDLGRRH